MDLEDQRRGVEALDRACREENDKLRSELAAEKKARAAESVQRLKNELELAELKEQHVSLQAGLLSSPVRGVGAPLSPSPFFAAPNFTQGGAGAGSAAAAAAGDAQGAGSPRAAAGPVAGGVDASNLLGMPLPSSGLGVRALLPGVDTAAEKAALIEVDRLRAELAAERKAREEWAAFVPASLGASEREARVEAERLRAELAAAAAAHEAEASSLRAELEQAWARAREIAHGFGAEMETAERMRAELAEAEASAHKEECVPAPPAPPSLSFASLTVSFSDPTASRAARSPQFFPSPAAGSTSCAASSWARRRPSARS